MKFVCDQCKTKYSIADDKVRRKVLKIRCKNCGNIIVVRDPQRRGPPPASAPRSTGAQALEQAFDGAFGGARLSPVAARPNVQAMHAEERRLAVAEPHVLDPEDAPTVMSPPSGIEDAEAAHEDEWYMAVEGHQFGPMSFEELGSRVRRGEARGEGGEDAFVWRDGFDDWVDVASVPELRPYAPPPPPPRGRSGLFPVPGTIPPGTAEPLSRERTPLPAGPPAAPSPAWSGAISTAAPDMAPAAAPTPDSGALVAPQPLGPPSGREGRAAPLPAAALSPPDAGPIGTPVATAQPPPRTPMLLKVAAAGGIVSTLMGVAILAYVFFATPPGVHGVQSGTPALSAVETGGAGAAQPDEAATAGDTEDNSISFSPMELGLSRGKQRADRSTPASSPGEPAKPKDKMTAEQKRLLSIYGEGKASGGIPRANQVKKRKRRRSRAVTSAELQRLLTRNKRSIQACYDRALKRDYSLRESRADVTLVVEPSGKVKRVNVAGVTSNTLISCVRSIFKRWVFRPLGGETNTEVKIPLVFRGS